MSDESCTETEGVGGVAVIGMACRFPGASNIPAYWENLRNGVESITFFSRDDLADLPPEVVDNPNYVCAHGVLENIDQFDANFFGLTPNEASITDPQQRIFFECSSEALEGAGYGSAADGAALGVFAGVGDSGYVEGVLGDPALRDSLGAMQVQIGNGKDHVAPRLSYLLNLRGPSVPIQTACSTSLVAVHMACQSLIHYECDMALAGGCAISPYSEGYWFQEGGVLSPDGHCRAFDAKARGTAAGQGAGVVLLKRVEDALADRDQIRAIIKGSAINNDGATKVGYTAPSVEGQRRVIQEAQAVASLEPGEISYVEAHGTGTTLGDPVEIEALSQAFGETPSQKQYCALGSVKTNIGHCDAAAGVAGLIKTILCLENKLLVPSLNFEQPNPQIDFTNSPFFVNTESRPWERTPRYAGVSSFGIGGTNAHVILQEPPATAPSGPSRPWQILTLAAKTPAALETMGANLQTFLRDQQDTHLADVAFTQNVGRKEFPARRGIVCRDRIGVIEALTAGVQSLASSAAGENRSVVFMFPGQGAEFDNLGSDLYEFEPCFRDEVDRCCELLQPTLGLNLSEFMFPTGSSRPHERLRQPSLRQPALFVMEYALARVWMEWGIHPEAMIGHSIGEYVASALSGVLALENALELVARRGQGIQALPPGAMLAVSMPEQALDSVLTDSVSLAAVNGPELCVLSGPLPDISRLETDLEQQGQRSIRLATTHAFHSRMVEPLMSVLADLAATFERHEPTIPYISNVTGTWMSVEDASDPIYWGTHLRNPVRFSDGLDELGKDSERIFLEVGPGAVLTRLTKRHPGRPKRAVSSLGVSHGSDLEEMLTALSTLWTAGIPVDWSAFYRNENRARVALPTYPFERKSYWVERKAKRAGAAHAGSSSDALAHKNDLADWLYAPIWKQAPIARSFDLEKVLDPGKCWLLFVDSHGVCSALVKRLEALRQNVILVQEGDQFVIDDDRHFTLNPHAPADYVALAEALESHEQLPSIIVHAWRLDETTTNLDDLEANLARGFSSVILVAQMIAGFDDSVPIRFGVLSNSMHRIAGEKMLSPEKATMLGALEVLPKEYSSISCKSIDVELSEYREGVPTGALDQLIGEFALESHDTMIAYRDRVRWARSYDALKWDEDTPKPLLEQDGAYVITNGLQEIGLSLVERLAQHTEARLILVDRTFFPVRDEWTAWIQEQGESDPVSRHIQRIQALGDQVRVISADTSNLVDMKRAKAEFFEEHGTLRGVFQISPPTETGLIQGKSAVELTSRMAARLRQPLILRELFSDLDFLIVFAENMAEAGGLGQVEQAATYAFDDHFAYYCAAKTVARVTTVDWGTRKPEQATNAAATVSALEQQVQEKRRLFGMTQEESLDILQRILAMALPQVIVSPRDYPALLAQQDQFTTEFFQQQRSQSGSLISSQPRSDLPNVYVAPGNEVEQMITDTWEAHLGIDKIGIQDSFFDLGGHSLLAVQLLSWLGATFPVKLTLKDFFDHPTIAELASFISQEQLLDEDAEELARLLEGIEELSEEEVLAALEVEPNTDTAKD